jgi:hypothetical protein
MRAFLFSFVPVCLVLAMTFFALNTLVEQRVKLGLRDSLQKSEDLFARANAESSRRIGQFLAVLADSAGLKAAIGLLREAPASQAGAAEVRRTIEAQLREMHALVGYDLLAVTDWKGRTVAAVKFQDGEVRSPGELPQLTAEPTLLETGGVLYELRSTPITIAGEQIGDLRLGSQFDLARYHLSGETALLRDGRILRATFSAGAWPEIEDQLRRHCTKPGAECEINRAGETFLAMPIHETHAGPFQAAAGPGGATRASRTDQPVSGKDHRRRRGGRAALAGGNFQSSGRGGTALAGRVGEGQVGGRIGQHS